MAFNIIKKSNSCSLIRVSFISGCVAESLVPGYVQITIFSNPLAEIMKNSYQIFKITNT